MPDNTLTGELILRKAWSSADNALKMVPSSNTSFSIELDAADGDNIQVIPKDVSSKTSITNETGVVVAAFDVSSVKSINLYTKTTTAITIPQLLTLEISPSDTDDVWIATTLTVTPSALLNTVVMGTPISIVARRARVSIAAANADGACDIYVVGHAI